MKGEGRRLKPVNCRCCAGKFKQEDREQIFKSFWDIDWNRKRDFIVSHVTGSAVKRRTVASDSRRAYTYVYKLPNPSENTDVNVCQKFFLRTLSVGDAMVQGAVKKAIMNKVSVSRPDGRAGRKPVNKTPEEKVEQVKAFLNKLPKMPSHYCRKDTQLEYLEAGWTVQKLYNAYKSECKEINPVSLYVFRDIFSTLNISVFHPRKDQCDVCVGHKNGLINLDEWNEHIVQKDLARSAKEADCLIDPKHVVITVDLQAVLLCPKSLSSANLL